MKRYCTIGFVFVFACIVLNSCKLDKPVQPGDVKATEIVTGTKGSGTNITNSNLSGNWLVKSTKAQYYDLNNSLVSDSPLASNFFTSILLSENTRTAVFEDLLTAAPNETYVLSTTTGADLYIQLSADPFSRTSNSTIHIINLTPSSMTWVAIDTRLVQAGGQFLYNAYQVSFTKQ